MSGKSFAYDAHNDSQDNTRIQGAKDARVSKG